MQNSQSFLNRWLCRLALGATVGLVSIAAQAETIAIPLGQQGKAWQVQTPKTGTSKADVRSQFGDPIRTRGPVGTPPISTWEYDQFNVYFEYDHVVHAVVKFNPNK